jgi:nucleoside-diphosphate-sugar epimerase
MPTHTQNEWPTFKLESYKEQYDLNYKSVIPTNIYGPNDNYDIVNGHVITFFNS